MTTTAGRVFTIDDRDRFRLEEAFVRAYAGRQPAWGYGSLSEVVFRRTYARDVPTERRTEEFWESARRVVEGTFTTLRNQVRTAGQRWDHGEAQAKAQDMFERMWQFKFLPPGRGLQFMGTETVAAKGGAVLNSCGFVSTQDIDQDFAAPFCWLADMLMLGVGVGFDTRGRGKVALVRPARRAGEVFVVPDTREGWVDALRVVLEAHVGAATLPRFDFSALRPAGAPLRAMGGTSSGPEPLRQLLADLTDALGRAAGREVTSGTIVDVANLIGRCVVSGGQRRSSEIAFGEPDDAEFASLKDPSDLNRLLRAQQACALADEAWCTLERDRRKVAAQRDALGALAEGALDLQARVDQIEAAQRARLSGQEAWRALEDRVNAHPLRTHRWASNNSIFCRAGQSYDAVARSIATNGEPGLMWLDVVRAYGRMADPPNHRDARAMGGNPCLPAGTRVLTRDGYRAIDQLVGQRVAIWNGTRWSDVEPRVTGHDQPLVRVSLSDGTSLVCTEYHEWLLAPERAGDPEERVRARDLRSGDTLAKFAMPVVEGGRDWPLAYTHGFFCGDGQVSASGSRGALLYDDKKSLASVLVGSTTGEDDAYGRRWFGMPRELSDKFVVPFDLSLRSRLDWIAGLLDADGAVLRNPNSVSLQLASVEFDFLREVRLMLTTLGVQAKVTQMLDAGPRRLPDGHGGHRDYDCREAWRILINATDTKRLVDLGMRTHRLDVPALAPQRDARRFVTVTDVVPVGVADHVYCFEDPLDHRGTFEGIVTGQCNEQSLWDYELCTLVETFPTNHGSREDWLETLKLAYLYAKVVTCVPTHSAQTNAVMSRNRRVGTSMAGVWEQYERLGLRECTRWWDAGYKHLRELDATYSGWMGVPASIKVSSVKPGGSIPLVAAREGGMKTPSAAHYMRTVRFTSDSPMLPALRAAGYRIEPDRYAPRTEVVYFPVRAAIPAGGRVARDVSVWEQAAVAAALQHWWADNQVSCTLLFAPEEARDLARVIETHEGRLKAVSFLPRDDHGYVQAPYIPCSPAEYESAASRLRPLDLSAAAAHEEDERYCQGDACSIVPGEPRPVA